MSGNKKAEPVQCENCGHEFDSNEFGTDGGMHINNTTASIAYNGSRDLYFDGIGTYTGVWYCSWPCLLTIKPADIGLEVQGKDEVHKGELMDTNKDNLAAARASEDFDCCAHCGIEFDEEDEPVVLATSNWSWREDYELVDHSYAFCSCYCLRSGMRFFEPNGASDGDAGDGGCWTNVPSIPGQGPKMDVEGGGDDDDDSDSNDSRGEGAEFRPIVPTLPPLGSPYYRHIQPLSAYGFTGGMQTCRSGDGDDSDDSSDNSSED
jgi:hypothetical protein